jgi:hypothetical protein
MISGEETIFCWVSVPLLTMVVSLVLLPLDKPLEDNIKTAFTNV